MSQEGEIEEKPIRFLPLPIVLDRVGISKPVLYRMIAKKEFPKAVPISKGRVGWVESQVTDWQKAKIRAAGIAA